MIIRKMKNKFLKNGYIKQRDHRNANPLLEKTFKSGVFCRIILQIDLSPVRGRAKFNRLARAISDVHYFVITTQMNDAEVKEAQDHLQKVME